MVLYPLFVYYSVSHSSGIWIAVWVHVGMGHKPSWEAGRGHADHRLPVSITPRRRVPGGRCGRPIIYPSPIWRPEARVGSGRGGLRVPTGTILLPFKRPRRPYHNPTCLFFHLFQNVSFPQQPNYFQYNGGAFEARLPENGMPPEPNLCMLRLIC